jgi:hypothetical protein
MYLIKVNTIDKYNDTIAYDDSTNILYNFNENNNNIE